MMEGNEDLLTHVADDPPRDAFAVEFDGRHGAPVSLSHPAGEEVKGLEHVVVGRNDR